MSFEIKDLAGISEPLMRLIEVLSAGAGNVYKLAFGRLIARREGQGTADKIREISNAVVEAREGATLVRYKDDNIEIVPTALSDRPLTLTERANATSEFLAEKRQLNLEAITAHAALQLSDKTSVPNEKPDEDWIARFFSVAPDISSSQMQELWGRILAGEIVKPGSYSLRTLDFVRNLTKSDAALIERLAEVVAVAGDSFVLFGEDPWYKNAKHLAPNDFFVLGELGIVLPTLVQGTLWESNVAQPASLYLPENRLLFVEHDITAGALSVRAWKLTKLGAELIPLSQASFDIEFARFLGQRFRQFGKKASVKEMRVDGNSISYSTIEAF